MACVSAQPSEELLYEVIHLGGQEAAVVPLVELRRLRAIERHAPADVIAGAEAEEAGIEEAIARHRAWVAAGRPNAERHEDVKRELRPGHSFEAKCPDWVNDAQLV